MRVLAVQLDIVWEDKSANHAKVRALLRKTPPTSRDTLVVLPEMFSTGFSMNVPAVSDTWSGEDRGFLRGVAREFGAHVLAGTVATNAEGKGLNQAVVVGPEGAELGRYTKLHPFSPGKEAAHYAAGPGPVVVPVGGFALAPMVCYDLRFPEAFRHATRTGATLFAVIANWPEARADHWLTLLKARAIENQAYVLGVNRAGRDPWLGYPGLSSLFDPKGNLVAQLGGEEGVLDVTIDPERVVSWRREFAALADMRPDLLG